MSDLVKFDFNGAQVRTVTKNNEPWIVAKDLAEAIGYKWNAKKTIGHVPKEWRGMESVSTPSGNQNMAILSEAGVFFFLNRSDKPKALPMQKWVAGEVLPSIRKTGGYIAPNATLDQSVAMIEKLMDRVEALTGRIAEVEQVNGQYRKLVTAQQALIRQWEAKAEFGTISARTGMPMIKPVSGYFRSNGKGQFIPKGQMVFKFYLPYMEEQSESEPNKEGAV